MMQQQKVHSKGLSDNGLGGFVKERMYTPSRKIYALNHLKSLHCQPAQQRCCCMPPQHCRTPSNLPRCPLEWSLLAEKLRLLWGYQACPNLAGQAVCTAPIRVYWQGKVFASAQLSC